jgi:hypothetical protein
MIEYLDMISTHLVKGSTQGIPMMPPTKIIQQQTSLQETEEPDHSEQANKAVRKACVVVPRLVKMV